MADSLDPRLPYIVPYISDRGVRGDCFLVLVKAWKISRQSPFQSELTPLLISANLGTREERIGSGSQAGGDDVVEYRAVDIAAVDLSTIKDGATIHSLPTCLVQLPTEDPSHVAALSWRWDFSHSVSEDPSLNVAHSIKYA
ncbi:hypothetical protein BU23DRAFT_662861 [Bimuria novae-zelandiae CBS 107.79]|uniref:Uncharacterized protein n=1 Tax=Bimuria novae-zelandiae CBS 107.79 TaxID=1447943 RepID=A0A6A5VQS7_9PLEO|nr:hypothetical protein BU23DRAFT_662861 [Bimuria novae-zelandiae CBS 107.79]